MKRPTWWALLIATAGLITSLFDGKLARAQEVEDFEWREYVRVTFYVLPGTMANGERVHHGAAACSNWMPFGTVLEFPDGFQVTCKDRGYGGRFWRGWVDVWAPSRAWGQQYVTGDYGDFAWVTVVRWGWGAYGTAE
jgi:hypothetical protein